MNERIKELRRSLGLSGEKFGERLGVGKTAISKLEKGENNITDQMFKSICREFNVNEDWLRNGTEPMYIEIEEEDQLMEWAGKVLSKQSDSFKKRFVKMLMSLTEDEWEFLEEKAKELVDYEGKKG